jgi:hypothetical protein
VLEPLNDVSAFSIVVGGLHPSSWQSFSIVRDRADAAVEKWRASNP